MQYQEYILENQNSFNLKHIFECGQCFRWNLEDDGSYTGVIKDAVINVKENGQNFCFKGKCSGDIKKIIKNYFDLDTDYEKIKGNLSKIDNYMKTSIKFGDGIRILNQDFWECIISFIISANNNIPRIKKIIERISKEFGKKIEFQGQDYFCFPTPEELSRASVEDLRNLGLGFRDKRVHTTTKMVLNKEFDFNKVQKMEYSDEIRDELLKLDGVGPKVADCIILFSLHRYDVFPIDVWVRRVMNELYIHNKNEEKVNKKMLNDLAKEKFHDMAGLAQQYLFYWKRSA